jgi:RHS repeat-associated protein
VTGSVAQYTYDANGNMLTDDINRNKDIKYDHRNLITQLRHKKIVLEDSLVYLSYYYYDEAGNRIRKRVYQYIGVQTADSVESPDEEDIGDSPGTWELIRDELYSRGADGKELAIYVNSNIKQTNIWGFGHEGYITTSDAPNFYLKDHLGSIRIVTNENDEVISAQDGACPRVLLEGDAWGYLMEGRTYESDESVYKYTGKQRDVENLYDYYGARYYDGRIGRWGQVEPLLDKYPQYSPYNYSMLNPLKLIDINGLDVVVILSGWAPGSGGREVLQSEYSQSENFEFLQVLNGLQEYATENNLQDVDIKAYWSSAGILRGKDELSAAIDFITSNLESEDEKVYIYGYSQGGENAIELSEMLGQKGINVYNLTTVDAYNAHPVEGTRTEIPSNVKYNYNYYQLMPDELGAHGNKNTGSNKTKVRNKYYINVEHKDMDRATSEDVQRNIRNTIK